MKSKKKCKPVERRRRKPYTKGELNRLVDSLVHPFYRENEAFRIIDGLVHGAIEGDPEVSVKKFIRYNLPAYVKKLAKKK